MHPIGSQKQQHKTGSTPGSEQDEDLASTPYVRAHQDDYDLRSYISLKARINCLCDDLENCLCKDCTGRKYQKLLLQTINELKDWMIYHYTYL